MDIIFFPYSIYTIWKPLNSISICCIVYILYNQLINDRRKSVSLKLTQMVLVCILDPSALKKL